MSNEIEGKFTPKFKKSKIAIVDSCPAWMSALPKVPVNVLSEVNRPTLATTIESNLKKLGGFCWALWIPPSVARFPDGRLRLGDGDHRRHKYRLAFPHATELPVLIHDVKNMKEYHRNFAMGNGTVRKNVSPEENFVHKVLSGDTIAISMVKPLINCKLRVHCSSETGGFVGDPNGFRVRIGGFQKAIKHSSESDTRYAADLLCKTFATDREVHAELLEGVAVLFADCPILSPNGKHWNRFETWFKTNAVKQQRGVSLAWKKMGGQMQNKHGISVAKGILTDFKSTNRGPNIRVSSAEIDKRLR